MERDLTMHKSALAKMLDILADAGFSPRSVFDGECKTPVQSMPDVMDAVFEVDDSTICFSPRNTTNGRQCVVWTNLNGWRESVVNTSVGCQQFDSAISEFLNWSESQPLTGAERQARIRASGRQIAVVIRDGDALEALAALESAHGGVTAAIVHALRAAK